MDYKKAKNKKVKAIKIEAIDPIIIETPKEIFISEKEQIKIDLKEIQQLLNSDTQSKKRGDLLISQMELQIKLKSL